MNLLTLETRTRLKQPFLRLEKNPEFLTTEDSDYYFFGLAQFGSLKEARDPPTASNQFQQFPILFFIAKNVDWTRTGSVTHSLPGAFSSIFTLDSGTLDQAFFIKFEREFIFFLRFNHLKWTCSFCFQRSPNK